MYLLAKGVTLFLALCVVQSAPRRYRCPLAWVDFNPSGSGNLPSSAVPAKAGFYYIARAKPNNIDWFLGVATVMGNQTTARIPFGQEIFSTPIFQVLVNRHGCKTQWINPGNQLDKSVLVYGNEFNSKLVGRAARTGFFQEEMYVPGPAVNSIFSNYKVTIPSLDSFGRPLLRTASAELLISYTEGLQTKLSDFVWETEELQNGVDFLGLDVIENESGATISQTVTHRKYFSTSYTFIQGASYHESFTSSSSLWFAFRIPLTPIVVDIGVKWDEGEGAGSGFMESVTNTTSTEIIVSRTIEVPPYTSVEACSTVTLNREFATGYVARASYKIPGWTDVEVAQQLYNEFGWDEELELGGDQVSMWVEGTFKANMVLSTDFMVVPKDSGGCMSLKRRLAGVNSDPN